MRTPFRDDVEVPMIRNGELRGPVCDMLGSPWTPSGGPALFTQRWAPRRSASPFPESVAARGA
eukprot:3084555-Pyramimonas_sp.AAC.1